MDTKNSTLRGADCSLYKRVWVIFARKTFDVVHLISFSFYLGMVPFVCKDNTLLINKRDKASFFTCSYKVPRDGLRRGASTVKVAFAGRFGFQPVTKGIQMHFVPTGIGGVGSCRQGAV